MPLYTVRTVMRAASYWSTYTKSEVSKKKCLRCAFCQIFFLLPNNYVLPPPLVQRCNGSTAGLGYLEVLKLFMQILLLGRWAIVSELSTPNGGEGYNSSTDLNPNTFTSLQLHCIQGSRPQLADKTTSKPQTEILYVSIFSSSTSILYLSPYCTYTYI
jgi:hypothetical protein